MLASLIELFAQALVEAVSLFYLENFISPFSALDKVYTKTVGCIRLVPGFFISLTTVPVKEKQLGFFKKED